MLGQNGSELIKQKSETIKANPSPHYNHTAVFQIARNHIDSVLILVQVFGLTGGFLRRKNLFGWLCLGGGEGIGPLGPSTADSQQHWQDMRAGAGTTVNVFKIIPYYR